MRKAWFRRLGLAAVAGLALAGTATGATGCASPRDEISRVQPNGMLKNDLVGDFRHPENAPEFYQRNLILEVHRTNPWFSDGLQDLTRRVRFEITERFLIARNAYEYIKDSDGKGGAKGKVNNGAIVGIWPITSHFTIQRSYNPVTGEETNVLEENTTDLRWYERDHMRVDWSMNLASDPNQIFWWEQIGGDLQVQPVPFYENDPKKPNASNFAELHDGGYFDVTMRWLAKPAAIDYYGYRLPLCLLRNFNLHPQAYTEGTYECNDQEVTIRSSFWKVPVDDKASDYEVAPVDGQQGNINGNLTLDRSGYDRIYGITDQTWHKYIMRYNLWQKSHDDRICGEDNKQSTGDKQCAGVGADDDPATTSAKLGASNSTCDLNAKRCSLPYSKRTVKTLNWYADQELPEQMWAPTLHAVDQWNTALSRAIAYAREAECRKDGGVREECHVKFFKGDIDVTKEDEPNLADGPVTVLCHNPVKQGDPKSCGPVNKTVRKGDIREHMIAWWKNPSINNPLGVIVWSGDPLTGENIGSLVNVFGASVQSYSSRARDYIQLINGDVSPAEYAAGKPAEWYMENGQAFSNDVVTDPVLNSYSTVLANKKTGGMSKAEVDARIKAVDVKATAQRLGLAAALKNTTTQAERVAAMTAYVKKQHSLGAPGFADATQFAAKLGTKIDALKKHGVEGQVFNDQWVKSVGVNPTHAGAPEVLEAYSPFRGSNPMVIAQAALKDFEAKREKHMCSLEIGESLRFDWLSGYAAKMKARYPDGAVASGPHAKAAGVEGATIDRIVRGKIIYQELLAPTYEFTLLHEMGHLMSMEHDFPASWDSPDFRPEYWILRANGSKDNMKECDPANPRKATDPDTCMGPRWIDPATTDELGTTKGKEHDSIDSYADSSVMDYKFDTIYSPSLGAFDKMSAKFIYTRMVEVFDDDKYSLIKNSRAIGTQFLPTLAALNSESWYVGTAAAHYTEMARKLNLFDPARCRPQTPDEAAVGIGALGLVCAPIHKDHAFLRDMTDELPKGGYPEFFRTYYSREKKDVPGVNAAAPRSRWMYKSGDGRTSYVHNYVYDNGADFYEITQDALELYDLKYLDYFFRKGQREASIYNAGRAMYWRFFDRVQALQWNAISDVARETLGGEIDPGTFSDHESKSKLLSLTLLFDGMQKALLRPQPGAYVANKPVGGMYDVYSVPETGTAAGDFKVALGDSRYIDNEYDLTKMYDYQAYAKRGGSFLEKPLASIALTDARPQLSTVARETYLDGRNVMFSFRSAIPKAFDRLVAGVMADDWDTVAPYVVPSEADLPGAEKGFKPMHTMTLWENDPTKIVRPAGARLLDPMLGYRTKVPAMFLMLLYQPIDSNMELVNRTRIWVEGSIEAIKVPEAEKVRFYDPVEGTPWAAKSFGTEKLAGKVGDIGIGARMIEHANELMMAAFNVETEVVDATTGQKKVKYGPDGRPMKAGGGVLLATDIKDAAAAAKLRQYVGFMNQTRQLLIWLGYGPCHRSYESEC